MYAVNNKNVNKYDIEVFFIFFFFFKLISISSLAIFNSTNWPFNNHGIGKSGKNRSAIKVPIRSNERLFLFLDD